jgi:hypothetical protein
MSLLFVVTLFVTLFCGPIFVACQHQTSTPDCPTQRAAALHNKTNINWIPECEKDGSFKIHQKNVSGTPFCATSKGVKIYQPSGIKPHSTLICECPMRVFELLTSKHRRSGVFVPFCTMDGGYRAVQCRPGNPGNPRSRSTVSPKQRLATCFCADENGKNIGEKPVGTEDSYCDELRKAHKKNNLKNQQH